MKVLINQLTLSNGNDLVNPVGELIPTVFDVNPGETARYIPARYIGDAREPFSF